MRKLKLFKSLLVVAMLLVGGVSSVWGADTFLTTWTGQVGTATNSGNFKYATKKIKIAAGETYVYTLTNFNDGNNSNYWKNWVVEGNLGSKYFDCEARGNQWQSGDGPTPSYSPVMAYTDVENFQTAYNGANVTITISRNAAGDQFTVTHTSNVLGTTDGNTEKYYGGTWTVAVGAEEDWDIYITEEEAHFVVTSVTYTDAESNVTNYNPLYQRGYTTAWSSDDIAAGKWVRSGGNAANVSATASDGLKMDTYTATLTNSSISYTDGNILTYDIIWNTGASYGSSNEAYLKIGDAVTFATSSQEQYGKVTIGSNDAISIPNACSKNNNNREGDVWTIHMVVNTSTHKVTELTINGNIGNTKVNYSLTAEKSFSSTASFSSAQIGLTRVNTASSLWCAIKSINIDQETYSTPTATVTYKYEDTSGNSLSAYQADVQHSEEVETTISDLIAGDLIATFFNGTSNKYVYSSYSVTDDYTKVQEGGNTVTLKFTDYPSTAYTVKAQVSGSDLTTLASGTAYFDGSTTEYWSKYIKVDDQWYVADENTYGSAITAATTNVAFTLADINYFFEMENLTRSGGSYLTEVSASYSNNSRLRLSKGSLYYTPALTGGTYLISIPWENGNNNANEVYVYTRSAGGDLSEKLATFTAPKGSGTFTATITVPDGYSIAFNGNEGGSANNNARMDYMTLISTVSATITSAGWATLYTPYALDFSSFSSNFKAYTATLSENTVTLNEVTTVPANTGVVLKGAANTYNIPVIASSETAKGALMGSTTAATEWNAVDGKDLYVLIKNNDDKAQFTKVGSGEIAAKKAYLPIDQSSGARLLSVVFDDGDATGISNATAEMKADDAIFNLAGQRVAQPANGLYIVNGKKVIVK